MPVRNAAQWLNETFESLMTQMMIENIHIELSIYNDGSSASSLYFLNLELLKFFFMTSG